MSRIFISYRRSDTEMAAGRLAGDLRARFGEAAVFRDKESIPIGADWAQEIRSAIGERGVLLVLIGDEWAEKTPEGKRRIDDPQDAHRNEIAAGLQIGCVVVPVLVGNAGMPAAESLPEPLRRLTQFNAMKLRDDEWDGYDFPRLAKLLEQHGFKAEGKPAAADRLKTSSKAIAALVIMAVALIGLGNATDAETHLGVAVIALVALVLGGFALRDTRAGLAKGQVLAVLAMVFSALAALAGFGEAFSDGDGGQDPTALPAAPPAGVVTTPSLPAPNAPPVAAAAIDLNGHWTDAAGGVLEITQRGAQLVMRDLTPGSPFYGVQIAGALRGRNLESSFTLPAGPVVMRLALSPDNDSLLGEIAYPSLGTRQPYALHRE